MSDAPKSSIEMAVAELVRQIMIDGGYITAKRAETIAKDAIQAMYEEFRADITRLTDQLEGQRERQDRLWDQIFTPKVAPVASFWAKYFGWLAFWRGGRG